MKPLRLSKKSALLRIGRWAPFLIYYVIVAEMTGALTLYWLWTYGAITVAWTAGYELLIARSLFGPPY